MGKTLQDAGNSLCSCFMVGVVDPTKIPVVQASMLATFLKLLMKDWKRELVCPFVKVTDVEVIKQLC